MIDYTLINLRDLLNAYEKDSVTAILSDFYCPYNKDVENFLKQKAIEFSKQGYSATHLVFTTYKGKNVLVGYFTLASKYLNTTTRRNALTNTMRKRIGKFAKYDRDIKSYIMAAPLIGQLGKNYTDGLNELITGDELLKMACDKVVDIQCNIGGSFVYLECEDSPRLLEFYDRNGFVNFGKRELEPDEEEVMSGKYLVQLLKYLKKPK